MDSETATPIEDILKRISRNGIHVDLMGVVEEVKRLQREEAEALDKLAEHANAAHLKRQFPADWKKNDLAFNPRSQKHLGAWFEERGVKRPSRYNEEALEEQLKPLDPEMFVLVMQARRLRKYWGDLNKLRDFMDGERKIHVQWTLAETGRWYTGKPNIQTMAKVCREYLIPEPGNGFYVVDWRQQELRILAHVSQEPKLLEAFANDEDPHVAAYEQVTGGKWIGNEQHPDLARSIEQRNLGKLLNYAIIYGLEADGLGARLHIDNATAQTLIDRYFERFPRLAEWRDEHKTQALEDGEIRTLGGRIIPINFNPNKRKLYGKGIERAAVSYYIQGSAADMMTEALQRVLNHEDGAIDYVRAQMHDAYLLEVPEDPHSGPHLLNLFKDAMESDFYGIHTPVDIKGPAPTWRQAMDWTEPEVAA